MNKLSTHLHSELKKEFQLERMILFSDAVFAIAITLLVIEIKIPDIPHEDVTDQALLNGLKHLIPKFAGFIISFLLIAMYWTVHHRMFGYVIDYTHKLLWLNLFFLFFIVLMPFATGFYGEYAGQLFTKQLKVPMTFYVLNIVGVGIFNYFLWRHISNPVNKVLDPSIDTLVIKMAKARSIIVPCVFLCMLPVAYFIHIAAAAYIPMLIPIVMKLILRHYTKNSKPAPLPVPVNETEIV